jgi:rubrerythrin
MHPGLHAGIPVINRMFLPVHRWVWQNPERRLRKLLCFAEVEGDGGRDILRAAEVTSDPLLRRLYLAHAIDELHHSDLFRDRGTALLRARLPGSHALSKGRVPVDHGLDDLRVEEESDNALLAFLHLAEKTAAGRFAIYREVVDDDPSTRAIFEEILRDEVFHMNYTYTQLARIAPRQYRRQLWRTRASRLWKSYLRVATAIASVIGTLLLTIQYFILLPPFAWMAKRAAQRERPGWTPISPDRNRSLTSHY